MSGKPATTRYEVTYTATYYVEASTETAALNDAMEQHDEHPNGTWDVTVEDAQPISAHTVTANEHGCYFQEQVEGGTACACGRVLRVSNIQIAAVNE